jgi:hypothetical protein
MLLEDRPVLEYPCDLQSGSLLYEIYNVVAPYLRISSTLGTYDVRALGIDRMCLR